MFISNQKQVPGYDPDFSGMVLTAVAAVSAVVQVIARVVVTATALVAS